MQFESEDLKCADGDIPSKKRSNPPVEKGDTAPEKKKQRVESDCDLVGGHGESSNDKDKTATPVPGKEEVSSTVIELEKKRTSLLQKLVAAPNIDATTTSVLQDVGNGLRYGRYATTHKPKVKTKSKGWQFHYNKETGGKDPPEEKTKKKKKKKKEKREQSRRSSTTTTTTTSTATIVSIPPPNSGGTTAVPSQSYAPSAYPPYPSPTQPYMTPPSFLPPQYGQVSYAPTATPQGYPAYPSSYPQSSPYGSMVPTTFYSSQPPHISYPSLPRIVQQPQQPQPQQPQQPQQQISNLLQSEAHLGFMATALAYIENYKQYLWVFAPLPTIILDESVARYLLTHPKGKEEQSVLALSFCICVCRGAMLAGDVAVHSEYYNKADQMAQYLEGIGSMATNYAFAAALLAMSQHGQYFMLDNDKNDKYLKTAMRICVKINALNSDVYLRCLYMVVCRPAAKTSDVKNLNKELEKLKRMPYFALELKTVLKGGIVHSEEGMGGSFLESEGSSVNNSNNNNENNNDNNNGVGGPLAEVERYSRDIQLMGMPGTASSDFMTPPRFISIPNLNAINSVFVVVATVQRGMSLYKNEASKANPADTTRLRESLYQLLDLTTKLETEVKMIQFTSLDPLPTSIVRFVKLFKLAVHAECKQLAREYDDAVDWAVKFLVKTKKPGYRLAFEGAPRFVSYVLSVFLKTQQMDLFWQQISAIENWMKLVPLIKGTVVSFTTRVRSATIATPQPSNPKPKKQQQRGSNNNSNNKSNNNKRNSSSTSKSMATASLPPSAAPLQVENVHLPPFSTNGMDQGIEAMWHELPSDGAGMTSMGGDDLLKQLDAQKEKRRLLKEKIEVMQNIMNQLKTKKSGSGATSAIPSHVQNYL